MSSSESFKANDTIVNMVTNFKPKLSSEKLFNFSTPTKRSVSPASSAEDVTPVKKFKEDVKIFDASPYMGSPREVRRLRAELLDSRNTKLILEKRIGHLHGLRKELELQFDSEVAGLKTQQEKDRKSIIDLENQLQSIRKRESSVRAELDEFKSKYIDLKKTSELKIEELESKLQNLSSELQIVTSDDTNEITTLKRKVYELEFIYNAAKEEIEAHKKLVEELTKKLSSKAHVENELEIKNQALQRAQLQLKEMDFNKESYLEYQQQAKSQQQKLSMFPELQKENEKFKQELKTLKDEVYNKLILEEQVNDLETRLKNSKEQEAKYAALQVTNSQNEIYLEEFRSLARAVCETTTSDSSLPQLLRSFLERLQKQEITLTSDKIQLQSQLSAAEHEASVARTELEENQKHSGDVQTTIQNQRALIHRMQKKLALVSRERDSYRKQLDSYEKDLTICINPASSANPGSIQMQTQQERINGLEKVVDDYRELVQKLEADLQKVNPELHSELPPIRIEQVARLQNDLEKMKQEMKKLRDRKDELEIQLEEFLVGQDYTKGRILHVSKNPLTDSIKQRETEKEKLEEEVDRLKKKIRKLEEGLEASQLQDVSLTNNALKEQVRSSEEQLQRLKDYFKNAMQEFRNVIYMLLGYKIDKAKNSQYKLTSMYAERQEDYLCFHLNTKGALDLLENEFSSILEELVEEHLRHDGSIPVFLSALTLRLFKERTVTNTYHIEVEDDNSDDD